MPRSREAGGIQRTQHVQIAMAQYFFNLTKPNYWDSKGTDVASPDEAVAHAQRVARTLLGEVIGQTLQVVDESGSEIAQIKLSESGLSD